MYGLLHTLLCILLYIYLSLLWLTNINKTSDLVFKLSPEISNNPIITVEYLDQDTSSVTVFENFTPSYEFGLTFSLTEYTLRKPIKRN